MRGRSPLIEPPWQGFIAAQWPAPERVRAGFTTRLGGVSEGPYASFTLGDHVGDEPARVAANRRRLVAEAGLPGAPQWLTQVHGTRVVQAPLSDVPEADAVWTEQRRVVCAVLTADCLPVLMCSDDGERVAAAHAGWRGLVGGVLEATVAALGVPGERLLVWLGPAIGPRRFEVGPEVRAVFLAQDPEAEVCFQAHRGDRWLADLYQLARRRLAAVGVRRCFGGDFCTVEDAQRFYSYRRDGVSGRMASVIWRE